MCVDMGVHNFGKGGGGGSRKRGSQKGGFTKRGVHVNSVNPPGYGPASLRSIRLPDCHRKCFFYLYLHPM